MRLFGILRATNVASEDPEPDGEAGQDLMMELGCQNLHETCVACMCLRAKVCQCVRIIIVKSMFVYLCMLCLCMCVFYVHILVQGFFVNIIM